MTLSPDILKRIRRIQVRTRHLVQTNLGGAYQSRFKGQGLTFTAIRPYVPGDDIRAIDWQITARTSETHIREFTEERNLEVMILIDGSRSLMFGTEHQQKRELAAELGGILAYMAAINQDKVGLMIFTDTVEYYLPPGRGRHHVTRLIRDLLVFQPHASQTNPASALAWINRTLKRGSLVFVISDFHFDMPILKKSLAITGQRFTTLGLVLIDALEEHLPSVGLLNVRDAETQDEYLVDTSASQWREKFIAHRSDAHQQRLSILSGCGIDTINTPMDGDYIRALSSYFGTFTRRHV